MAVLPVLIYGDSKLRRKAEPVAPEELARPEFQAFLDDMAETLYVEDGIGLAAPQVGVNQRVVVIDVSWIEKQVKDPIFLINPTLEPHGEPVDFDEGCLSLPEVRGKVVRPSQARLSFTDRHGHPQAIDAEGLLARCAQHEFDHLEGVLFVDRLSVTGKVLVQGKLKRLKRGR
jgi:peptide deformylase